MPTDSKGVETDYDSAQGEDEDTDISSHDEIVAENMDHQDVETDDTPDQSEYTGTGTRLLSLSNFAWGPVNQKRLGFRLRHGLYR